MLTGKNANRTFRENSPGNGKEKIIIAPQIKRIREIKFSDRYDKKYVKINVIQDAVKICILNVFFSGKMEKKNTTKINISTEAPIRSTSVFENMRFSSYFNTHESHYTVPFWIMNIEIWEQKN